MLLHVNQINKCFGNKHVLKNVTFQGKGGSALGLLGRNGSGKTTTIRIIMDVFPADSGVVTINGQPSKKCIHKIGYLPEERGLYPKRIIAEQMAYIGELRGMKAADARTRGKMLLEKLDAAEYFKKKLSTLSKGNQQKIQLAIALINDPEIVILDEPFSGLDPVNAKMLKDLVRELVKEGRMVIFSSHQMGAVEEFCDDICMINKGEIVMQGNLRQIKKSYPRNQIILVPDDDNSAGLQHQIKSSQALSNLIDQIHLQANGCVVTLKDEKGKDILFQHVLQLNFGIDSIRVLEPTLEEIFIEKAGVENETI